MLNQTATTLSSPQINSSTKASQELSTIELAQALAERLTITPDKWHQLKSNRPARAREQAAAALVFLLKDRPEEALARLQQAASWLDRSVSAPPCPGHGLRGAHATRSSK